MQGVLRKENPIVSYSKFVLDGAKGRYGTWSALIADSEIALAVGDLVLAGLFVFSLARSASQADWSVFSRTNIQPQPDVPALVAGGAPTEKASPTRVVMTSVPEIPNFSVGVSQGRKNHEATSTPVPPTPTPKPVVEATPVKPKPKVPVVVPIKPTAVKTEVTKATATTKPENGQITDFATALKDGSLCKPISFATAVGLDKYFVASHADGAFIVYAPHVRVDGVTFGTMASGDFDVYTNIYSSDGRFLRQDFSRIVGPTNKKNSGYVSISMGEYDKAYLVVCRDGNMVGKASVDFPIP